MKRLLRAGSGLALALWLAGCSTLSGDFHQKVQIETLDAQNRPIEGMHCVVGSGSSAQTVTTPAQDVRVRRSVQPLSIECQRDGLRATATVKSRRERMEEALLPFGSVGVFVDHLSGTLYAYPTTLRLRTGQQLVLEHGGEAQIATSEPIAPPPEAPIAHARPVEVAVLLPAVAVNRAAATVAAPKAVPKTDRAARPIKTASAAPATPKARAAAPPKPDLQVPAARVAASEAHSAPVNW